MIPLLALCWPFVGGGVSDPAPPRPPAIPSIPSIDIESFHRQHLEGVRRSIIFMEGNIKLFEQLANEQPPLFTQDEVKRIHKRMDAWRAENEKWKKLERELAVWENQRRLNPGQETDRAALERLRKLHTTLGPPSSIAPPPREKK
jgi:hypothetical protein